MQSFSLEAFPLFTLAYFMFWGTIYFLTQFGGLKSLGLKFVLYPIMLVGLYGVVVNLVTDRSDAFFFFESMAGLLIGYLILFIGHFAVTGKAMRGTAAANRQNTQNDES